MQKSSIDQILSEKNIFDRHLYIHLPRHTNRTNISNRGTKARRKPCIKKTLLESTSKTPFDASLDNDILFISTLYNTSSAITVSPSFSSNTSSTSASSCDECIWADPVRIKENPTRYQYVKSYLQQRQVSLQSALPLIHPCTFYTNNGTLTTYSVRPVFQCDTVWNFSSQWRHYKEKKRPSQLTAKESLFCFVKGVQPMWEDPVNRRGGRLLVNTENVDDVFEWILCAFVGGGFVDDGVVGVVVSRKPRGNRVEIWTDYRTTLETIPTFKEKLCYLLNSTCHEEIVMSKFKKHFM